MMPGSKRWPDSKWAEMLGAIIPILDGHRSGNEWWSFGGGTALAQRLGHRISYDIDLFIESAADLKALTPNANPAMKRLAGENKCDYPGFYLKVPYGAPLPVGEIDIIIATGLTDMPCTDWTFQGRQIRLETNDEIMAKKCCFRASTFKVRDVFDLAATLHNDTTILSRLKPMIGEQWEILSDRIARLAPTYPEIVVHDVNPTEIGRKFLTREAMGTVLDALSGAGRNGPGSAGIGARSAAHPKDKKSPVQK